MPLGQPRMRAATTAAGSPAALGVPFILLLVWLVFEFGRPPNPMKIPMAISIISVVAWVFRKQKQWTSYTPWWFALLGVVILGVPFATNNFSAFWGAENLAVLFVTVCLPLQSLLVSMHRFRVWLYVYLATALFVGLWAVTHGGYGPSGASGGQDENYVAAMMGLAVAIAYFVMFAEKSQGIKLTLAVSIVIFVGAIALGNNPSRGGFIGLCAVAVYCLARSPRKGLGITAFALIGVALVAIAGPSFWAEISTSADLGDGTADVRLEIWKAGFQMWKSHPFIGVGADNFRWVIGDVQSFAQFEKFGRSLAGSIIAHSLWVEMLAELGIAGTLITGILVYRTWTDLGRIRGAALRSAAGPNHDPRLVQYRCYADAIRAGILAVLVNGLFLSLFYYSHLWLMIAVGSALSYVYKTTASPELLTAGEPATAAPRSPGWRGAGPLPNARRPAIVGGRRSGRR